MDKLEAAYWLATVKQAMKGNEEAMEELQAEDKIRKEHGMPTVKEELIAWATRNDGEGNANNRQPGQGKG